MKIIVKIGSASLTHPNGRIDLSRIERLAWVLSDLRTQGHEIVLVSSGAIAVGMQRLALAERPRDVCMRQAASAVGQAALVQIYEMAFAALGQKIAQVLLTKDVLEHEQMRQNAQNSFAALLNLGVLPIVNENDAISTDELQGFSDNDQLAGCVAELLGADLCVLLSDIDALYDDNPRTNPQAAPIRQVRGISDELLAIAGGAGSSLGTGGMRSKLLCAQRLGAIGCEMVIASGADAGVLRDILDGKEIGTRFLPEHKREQK